MHQKENTYSYKALRPFNGTLANSADPDQMPHNTASDQGLQCLLTTKLEEWKIQPCSLPKIGNRPVLLIRVVQAILLYGLNKLSFFCFQSHTRARGWRSHFHRHLNWSSHLKCICHLIYYLIHVWFIRAMFFCFFFCLTILAGLGGGD